MRICLYARVSKAGDQTTDNQLLLLRPWAVAANHVVVGEFVDEISSKDTRPEKERVLRMLRLGTADGVAFTMLDRWGRSISELILELDEFSKTGKAIISLKEGLDLSSAAGRMMANMLAVMANFERDRIGERTKMGTSRARAQGKICGRHPVGCGCGRLIGDPTGAGPLIRHNGPIRPVRDASNKVVGWQDMRTGRPWPPIKPPLPSAHPVQSVSIGQQQTPVCLENKGGNEAHAATLGQTESVERKVGEAKEAGAVL